MSRTSLPIRKDGDGHKHSYSYKYSYGYGYGYGYGGYRKEKRPRKLNKWLLATTVALLAVAIPSIYFWHNYQTWKLSASLLERGDAMAAEENWKEASDAYYRVWDIRRDPELLGKVAPAYDKFAIHHNRLGVIASYQRALGVLPGRKDFRCRLAELLLQDGQNELALEQTEKVLKDDPADAAAIKWRAMAWLALHRGGKSVEGVDPLDALKDAYVANQSDFDLAVTLANFIRTDLEAANGSQLARQADAVMKRLVDVSPNDAKVYYARYRYKLANGLPGPRADLDQAVLLDPENPMYLQQSAWDALRDAVRNRSSASYLTARALFNKLIDLDPANGVGYLGLGDTEFLVQGDVDRAIQIWNRGRKRAGDSLPLLLRIAEGQTNTNDFVSAERTLEDIDSFLASLATRGAERDRNWGKASAGLYRGRVLLAYDKPQEAIPHLKLAAELGLVSGFGRPSKPTAFQALMSLGDTYLGLGQIQDAASSFERALNADRTSEAALLSASSAWSMLGDFGRAIRHAEAATGLPEASNETWRHLAQHLFERELTVPRSKRDWSEFNRAFAEARSRLPDSWELRILDVDHSIRQGDDLSQTFAKLLSIEQDFPNELNVWRQLPVIYESIGESTEANRTLDRLEEMTSSSQATKILLIDILLGRNDIEGAKRTLAGIPESQLTPFERWDSDYARLRIVETGGNADQIDSELTDLIGKYPENALLIEKFLDRRVSGASTTTVPTSQELLNTLKKIQKNLATSWEYYESRFELASDKPDFERIRKHLEALKNRRPYWSRTQELAGRLAILDGDQRSARSAFDEATSQTRPNPELIRIVVERRYKEADYVAIWRLLEQRRQLPSLASLPGDNSLAMLRRDLSYRLAPMGNDPSARIWPLFRNRSLQPDGGTVAERMIELGSTKDEPTRSRLLSQIEATNLGDPDRRAFIMGQAQYLAKKPLEAQASFGKIGSEFTSRLQAELYATDAEDLLNAFEEEPNTLLTATQTMRAQKRLEAVLRLRRAGRNDLEEARELLSTLVEVDAPDVSDQLLLSRVLHRLGDTQNAKSQLLKVVDTSPTAHHISVLVDYLIQSGDNEEARVWIEQLEEQTGLNRVSVSLRSRWLAALNRHAEIVPFVEAYAKRKFARSPRDVAKEMREIAMVYRDVNMPEDAKRWLALLASRYPDQAEPLALFLIENDETDVAVERCIEQLEENPTAETATLLCRILVYGASDDKTIARVEPLLEQSLRNNPDDTSLLFAAGNLKLKLGDSGKAIDLLTRVTKIQPGHYLAWNNLAAIVAEVDGREDEAMSKIDQAIRHAAYTMPTLLDTKAVVLMHQDRHRDAVQLLKDRVLQSRSAADPRYHFHLAMALTRIDRLEEASEALADAEHLELEKAFLTEFELQQLAALREKLAK